MSSASQQDPPINTSMSCSIVTLLPFFPDALSNWLACIGSGVGVVGRARLKAVKVDGKGFLGVVPSCPTRGDSTLGTDFVLLCPRGDARFLGDESGFIVSARTISRCCSSSCLLAPYHRRTGVAHPRPELDPLFLLVDDHLLRLNNLLQSVNLISLRGHRSGRRRVRVVPR